MRRLIIMSKFQEIEVKIDEIRKQKEEHNVAIESFNKQRTKLEKEFVKKVRKLFGRVKIDLINLDTRLNVKVAGNEVFEFTYDTFTFKNIDKELAVELQYLYLEYYGEPREVKPYFGYEGLAKSLSEMRWTPFSGSGCN